MGEIPTTLAIIAVPTLAILGATHDDCHHSHSLRIVYLATNVGVAMFNHDRFRNAAAEVEGGLRTVRWFRLPWAKGGRAGRQDAISTILVRRLSIGIMTLVLAGLILVDCRQLSSFLIFSHAVFALGIQFAIMLAFW
jgi:hypothetical protein